MQKNWIQNLMGTYMNYRKFMTGRYGRFDELNRGLVAFSLILLFIKGWISSNIIWILILISLALAAFRFLSKKIYVRSHENQRVLKFFGSIGNRQVKSQRMNNRKQAKATKEKEKQRKQANIHSVIFKCENCGQSLRVPQGKGKIKITCSKCHHVFTKEV